jgi:hypothetical protein
VFNSFSVKKQGTSWQQIMPIKAVSKPQDLW